MKTTINTLTKIAVLTGVLVVALAASYLYAAWNEPEADPPGANTPTPLNVGVVDQVKAAGLSLKKLIVNGPVMIQDGTQGDGKVLTSDSDGIASWQTPGSTSLPTCADGEILAYDTGVSDWVCTTPSNNLPSCSNGQVAIYDSGSNKWVCGNLPSSAICTYAGTEYSTGASCTESKTYKCYTATNCCTDPDVIQCQSDGSWSGVYAGCGYPAPPMCGY